MPPFVMLSPYRHCFIVSFPVWLPVKLELTTPCHTAHLLSPPVMSLVPRTRPFSECPFPSCLWWVKAQLCIHVRGWRLIARHFVVNGKLRGDNCRGEHVAQVWGKVLLLTYCCINVDMSEPNINFPLTATDLTRSKEPFFFPASLKKIK